MDNNIIVSKEILQSIIRDIINNNMKEWKSMDNVPRLSNQEDFIGIIDQTPKVQTQVFSQRMPIEDQDWVPGNNIELGFAMKQFSELVPESQIEWYYESIKRLIDDALDKANISSSARLKDVDIE